LRCDSPISAQAKPDQGYTVVNDAVAVQTEEFQVEPTDGPRKFFAKTALFVRAGKASTLHVEGNALIAWGNHAAEWTPTLRIPACPPAPGGGGPWLVYPGGWTVDQAGCVGLDVQTGKRGLDLAVPVGHIC
jgi:hypothetical protein